MNDYFEQSVVWDLTTGPQKRYLESLTESDYVKVMSDMELQWRANMGDYIAAISEVVG